MTVGAALHEQDTLTGRVAAVQRAIAVMRHALDRPLQLADIASSGGYSPFHFHRIFREITSLTPGRFLTALRIEEARRLLAGSPMTVGEIGVRVGCASLGTFTTQFTRLVGLPPARFRTLVRSLGDRAVGERPIRPGGAPGLGTAVIPFPAPPAGSLLLGRVFVAGNLDERPGMCVLSDEPVGVRLAVPAPPADSAVFLAVIPGSLRMVDLLAGEAPDGCIGAVRLSLRRVMRVPARVQVSLRRGRPTDPPVLAVSSVRWLIRPECSARQ
jgi:AraC family transcriptional regulator